MRPNATTSCVGLPQSGSEPRSGPEPRRTGPRSGPRFGIVTEPDLQDRFRFGGMAEPSEAVRTGSEPPNRKVGMGLSPRNRSQYCWLLGVNQAGSPHVTCCLGVASKNQDVPTILVSSSPRHDMVVLCPHFDSVLILALVMHDFAPIP